MNFNLKKTFCFILICFVVCGCSTSEKDFLSKVAKNTDWSLICNDDWFLFSSSGEGNDFEYSTTGYLKFLESFSFKLEAYSYCSTWTYHNQELADGERTSVKGDISFIKQSYLNELGCVDILQKTIMSSESKYNSTFSELTLYQYVPKAVVNFGLPPIESISYLRILIKNYLNKGGLAELLTVEDGGTKVSFSFKEKKQQICFFDNNYSLSKIIVDGPSVSYTLMNETSTLEKIDSKAFLPTTISNIDKTTIVKEQINAPTIEITVSPGTMFNVGGITIN